ncbi:hypothetical protein BTA51_05745 [Hahella sp. CCB-MM4]|uniref:DUF2971 domain-containing protein n=1 Tax=Hahella sp. (strain CCB-MM4) TaxID=1926491 RepID=UPI000B9BD857|nr:DUF2971 domain-containing protein [Hahella sp. CCB-MM4]OZG74502.1 hypothetical protein BTA51_05745 [Hahella sp. CCB-MM4]
MIGSISAKLYSDNPTETLYHYTSYTGLMGIVESGTIWAGDIRYMNDSAELRHTADLIRQETAHRISGGHTNPVLLNSFFDWVSRRITNGHMLFGASFRANGNLLSQWRGYSTHGKGVSIGFSPSHILECSGQQGYQVGRCLYNPKAQQTLIAEVVDAVETMAATSKDNSASYVDLFRSIEVDLLRIAAILKHPSFQEEDEWRIVSPVVTDFMTSSVKFRQGTSMLVPYQEFHLKDRESGQMPLEHIFLGPTPNMELSMNSLTLYLTKQGIQPVQGLSYCQIPYRLR